MPWLHLCSVSSLKVAAVNPQRAKLHVAKRIRLAGRVVVGSGGGGTGSEGAMAKAEEALLAGKAVALFAPFRCFSPGRRNQAQISLFPL